MTGREHFTVRTFPTDKGEVHLLGPGSQFADFVRAAARKGDDTLAAHLGAAVGATLAGRRPSVLREQVVEMYDTAVLGMWPPLDPVTERLAQNAIIDASEAGSSINVGMSAVRDARGAEA